MGAAVDTGMTVAVGMGIDDIGFSLGTVMVMNSAWMGIVWYESGVQ